MGGSTGRITHGGRTSSGAALAKRRRGAGAVSEAFLAASRMTPGDDESWYREWMAVAMRNHGRADKAAAAGHVQTAQNAWLRASGYYRQAEFWLPAHDPRRLATFELMEDCSKKFIARLVPAGEVVGHPLRERGGPVRLLRPVANRRSREAAGSDLDGRPRLDQGRDVVHAGPRRPATRHFGADDRRTGPGRHAAAPRRGQPLRL